MSALRNTSVFGDSPVNFTTKLKLVDFPSADWLSYLRTQLKAFVAEFVCDARDFSQRSFLEKIVSLEADTLKSYNSKGI